MDLIQEFMNIVLPPLTLIALLLVVPPYLILKFLCCIKRLMFGENVAGKVVIITGAASGIGKEIAYKYARRGACSALVDVKEDRLLAICPCSSASFWPIRIVDHLVNNAAGLEG